MTTPGDRPVTRDRGPERPVASDPPDDGGGTGLRGDARVPAALDVPVLADLEARRGSVAGWRATVRRAGRACAVRRDQRRAAGHEADGRCGAGPGSRSRRRARRRDRPAARADPHVLRRRGRRCRARPTGPIRKPTGQEQASRRRGRRLARVGARHLPGAGAEATLVRVSRQGRISTGLARPDYFNWPAAMRRDRRQRSGRTWSW